MMVRQWSGSGAGLAGWGTAIVIGLVFFGATPFLLIVAFGKALLLAVYVLYIIWMALLLYHVTSDAGVIATLGRELPRLASDRGDQALLLAWAFGSFLQGASGFGVPAAVVAPLLVGLGFEATTAVVVALMGHAWAVTCGSLGSSFLALEAASGINGEILAGPAAIYMGICCLLCGGFVLRSAGGWSALRGRWVVLSVAAGLMAYVQYALAQAGLWTLASFLASLVGMFFLGFWFTLSSRHDRPFAGKPLLKALWPYMLLTVVIVVGQVFLGDFLSLMELNINFPAVATRFGWETAGGPGRSIDIFGHPGALLFYASLFIFGWYRWQGTLEGGKTSYDGLHIARQTVRRSAKSTISIIALVAMGTTMQHTGMTQLLADALSGTGQLFPFLSPFIGALGAFMTGSNTNSNVVFADLQTQTAMALQLSVGYILAAQTAGGAIGSVFAPAKVVVGVSTVEEADEGSVLKLATFYGLLIVALLGGITLLI